MSCVQVPLVTITTKKSRARELLARGDVMYSYPVVNKRAARVECILMYNM